MMQLFLSVDCKKHSACKRLFKSVAINSHLWLFHKVFKTLDCKVICFSVFAYDISPLVSSESTQVTGGSPFTELGTDLVVLWSSRNEGELELLTRAL